MRVRISVYLAVLIGCLGLMLASGYAQEKKKTYAKGDTVKVRYATEEVTGKVVSSKISGFIDVEFDWKGKKITKTFPLTLVEVGAAPAATPATTPATPNKPATGTPKPSAGSKSPAPAKPKTPAEPTKPAATPPTSGKAAAPGNEQELRTWTSDTGKFKIEARFAGLEDGKVKLLKKDGTTVSVSLEKLTEADRKLANELANAKSPFQESEDDAAESPFQEVPPTAPPEGPKPAANAPSSATPPKKP